MQAPPVGSPLGPSLFAIAENPNILEILPLETLQAIWSQLKPKDMAACSLACRAWRSSVSPQLNLSRLLHLTKAMTASKPALAGPCAAMQQEMERALQDSNKNATDIGRRAWVQLRDTIAGDDDLLNGSFFRTYQHQDICRSAALKKKFSAGWSFRLTQPYGGEWGKAAEEVNQRFLTHVTDALKVHALEDAKEAILLMYPYHAREKVDQAVLNVLYYYIGSDKLLAGLDYFDRTPFKGDSLPLSCDYLIRHLVGLKKYQEALRVIFRLYEGYEPYFWKEFYAKVSLLFEQGPTRQQCVAIVWKVLSLKHETCSWIRSEHHRLEVADLLLKYKDKDLAYKELAYQVLQFRAVHACPKYEEIAYKCVSLLTPTDEPIKLVQCLTRSRCDIKILRRALEAIAALNYTEEKLECITQSLALRKDSLPVFWKRLLQSAVERRAAAAKASIPKKEDELEALLRDTPVDQLERTLKAFIVKSVLKPLSHSSKALSKERRMIDLAKSIVRKGHFNLAQRIIQELLTEERWRILAKQELLKESYTVKRTGR